MGDRGNIIVLDEDTNDALRGVVLYTHWRGSDIRDVVRETLTKQARWNDPPYLTRMLFDRLTIGQNGQETGFGISTTMGDNEYDILVVDVRRQVVATVSRAYDDKGIDAILWLSRETEGTPFADFVAGGE